MRSLILCSALVTLGASAYAASPVPRPAPPLEIVDTAGKHLLSSYKGKVVADTPQHRELSQVGYTGSAMPPPEAIAGTYAGPGGRKIKVPPLTAEERLTLIRWIDLGCPIDLVYT